jgi:multiple sugar transport system substrate-binding protein
LTLCAQDGGRDFIQDIHIDEKVGSKALDELKYHLEFLHPESINWNPIQVLDTMSREEKIIYAPFLFGYTNYARTGYSKNTINFTNSPKGANRDISTILGGVGLAISGNCKVLPLALAFLKYVTHEKTQKGIYTSNGGQPANLRAWKSKNNNELCNGFFMDTMETMDLAYVRPRHPGWNRFQEQGSDLLHHGIQKNTPSDTLMKVLNQLYQSIR